MLARDGAGRAHDAEIFAAIKLPLIGWTRPDRPFGQDVVEAVLSAVQCRAALQALSVAAGIAAAQAATSAAGVS